MSVKSLSCVKEETNSRESERGRRREFSSTWPDGDHHWPSGEAVGEPPRVNIVHSPQTLPPSYTTPRTRHPRRAPPHCDVRRGRLAASPLTAVGLCLLHRLIIDGYRRRPRPGLASIGVCASLACPRRGCSRRLHQSRTWSAVCCIGPFLTVDRQGTRFDRQPSITYHDVEAVLALLVPWDVKPGSP